MTARQIKACYLIHKWSSLICTAFLLLLCLTGLPLIFSQEIDSWLSDDPPYAAMPVDAPLANLDVMVEIAKDRYPSEVIRFVFIDTAEPQVLISLAPSWAESMRDPQSIHSIKFDARTGEMLKEAEPPGRPTLTVMGAILRLHTDLFADVTGELLIAAMGALFVIAIMSGLLLYAPFMKRQTFGALRADRGPRVKWLDLHSLLGIVVLAWTLVVGATGIMNALSTPLFALWQRTHVQAMLTPYAGKAILEDQSGFASVQAVFEIVGHAQAGMRVFSVVFPGARLGSPHHYMVWAKGQTPVTARLFSPALVDAVSGEVTTVVKMPWYLKTLELSRPLHFGDYGGLPLKIVWALFDIVAIVVLSSGLYLWLSRRKSPLETRLAEIESGAA